MTTNTNAANAAIGAIMTQVQVCAGAYALIGSRFDRGIYATQVYEFAHQVQQAFAEKNGIKPAKEQANG